MTSAQELADQYALLADSINKFRLARQSELSDEEFAALGDVEASLLHLSSQLVGQAIADTLAKAEVDAAQIIASAKAAQDAIRKSQEVQREFAIATAAVAMGLAISKGDVGGIGSGVMGLVAAIRGSEASTAGVKVA